jgi:alpha-tubulin suppressor-like RCC1 family protein
MNNGTIYSAGDNSVGQLGLGDIFAQNSFIPVALKLSTSNAKIISISAGGGHSLALDNEGTIWASGANEAGQLGLGDDDTTRYFLFTPVTF